MAVRQVLRCRLRRQYQDQRLSRAMADYISCWLDRFKRRGIPSFPPVGPEQMRRITSFFASIGQDDRGLFRHIAGVKAGAIPSFYRMSETLTQLRSKLDTRIASTKRSTSSASAKVGLATPRLWIASTIAAIVKAIG